MLYYFLKLITTLTYAAEKCGPNDDGTYTLCAKIPGAPATVGGPVEYLTVIYQYGVLMVGLVGFGLLVWNGLNYILQRSNYAKLADIKDHITQIVFGIILLVFASLLLNEIDPKILTSLEGGEFKLEDINRDSLNNQFAKMTAAQRASLERLVKSNNQLTFSSASIIKVRQIYDEYSQMSEKTQDDRAYKIDTLKNLFLDKDLTDKEKILLRSLLATTQEKEDVEAAFSLMSQEDKQKTVTELINQGDEQTAAGNFIGMSVEDALETYRNASPNEKKTLLEHIGPSDVAINAFTKIFKNLNQEEAKSFISTLADLKSPLINDNAIRLGRIWNSMPNGTGGSDPKLIFAKNLIQGITKQVREGNTNERQFWDAGDGIVTGGFQSQVQKYFSTAYLRTKQ